VILLNFFLFFLFPFPIADFRPSNMDRHQLPRRKPYNQRQDFTNEVTPGSGSGSNKPFYADWAGIQGSEHIRKLTDADIADFIKTQDSAMVMFYAPCKHS